MLTVGADTRIERERERKEARARETEDNDRGNRENTPSPTILSRGRKLARRVVSDDGGFGHS